MFGVWKKPTFTLVKGRISDGEDSDGADALLQGYLNDFNINNVSDIESLVSNSFQ